MLASSAKDATPRLMYVVTEDWYFVSHRLPLAVAAAREGYRVAVACRLDAHRSVIERAGVEVIGLRHLTRAGMNPLKELRALAELVRLYRGWRPDLVHHVSLKPVLYGSLAARLAGVRGCINAVPGFGYSFSSPSPKARAVGRLVRFLLRRLLGSGSCHCIVQNREDRQALLRLGAHGDRVHLIRGSGVDAERYSCPGPPEGDTVLMASRMLWSKGVGDFVELARRARSLGVSARFQLLGAPDEENPDHVPREWLDQRAREGLVEWLGHRPNVEDFLCRAAVVCLPTTYGEGVPKILLEAASCGRPIVSYDVPGCREIVSDGVNGYLVRPGDVDGLLSAVLDLLGDPGRRRAMGARGREMVLRGFTQAYVHRATLDVYRMALDRGREGHA